METTTTVTPEVMPDEQKEIALIVKQNAIEPTTAQSLQQSFAPLFREARDLIAQSQNVVVTDGTQTVQIKISREYRLALRQTRIKGEKLHKSLKEEYVRTGRAIDALKTLFLHSLESEEKRLDAQEKIVERLEAERKAALKTSREEALRPFGIDTSFMSLADMPDATFAQLLENTRAGYEAKVAIAAHAERLRIEDENARLREQARIREENEKLRIEAARIAKEQEAAAAAWKAEKEAEAARRLIEQQAAEKEAARVKAEADAKLEAARKEQARLMAERDAELERMAREQKKIDEARRQEREAYEATQRRIQQEAEAKAKQEREFLEAKAAQERRDAEARAQAAKVEADALAAKERAAREKAERELKAQKAAEAKRLADEELARKKAAAAPDKEKLLALAECVREIPRPSLSSPEAAQIVGTVSETLVKLYIWIREEANKL